MTDSDKASDQLLTEEAYARVTGKAGIVQPAKMIDEHQYMRQMELVHPNYPHVPLGYYQYHRDLYYQLVEERLRAHDQWVRYMEGFLEWRRKEASKIKAGNNGTQLGPREFTFTYGDHYETDEEAQRAMKLAVERLTKYYKDEIIEFHVVGEFTRAGRSHLHGWYHLTGGLKITDKNFKRAYPPWNPKKKLGNGFEGGHHATIDRVSDFSAYAEKELEKSWYVLNITNDGSA